MNKIRLYLLIFYFFSITSYSQNSQWVEWIADVEASYLHTDNLNYSAFSNDKSADQALALKTALGRFYQFSGTTRMHVAIELGAMQYREFNLMSNTELGISTGVRHKFGIGHDVPYIQLDLSYQSKTVDSSRWSNDLTQFSIEVGKHFTDKLSLALSIISSTQNGKAWDTVVPDISNNVFDQTYWHAFVFADYILSEDWLVSLSYARRDGDFNSACTGDNVKKVLDTMQVKAITFDDIFGGCVYKIDGQSNIYSSALSFALNNHSSLNFKVAFYQGHASDLDYQRSDIQLSYNYRY